MTYTAPKTETKASRLYFYRCHDCLSVVTSDEELGWFQIEDGSMRRGKCGGCGGWIELMGRTNRRRDRLVLDEERCPCDARCTHAVGPSCNCKCGGKNHGSHLWVKVTRDVGGVPTVQTPPDAAAKADKYYEFLDAAMDAVESAYGRYFAMKREGGYLQPGDFSRYLGGSNWLRDIYRAQRMKSHKGRNGKLAKIAAAVKLEGLKKVG